ncbi:MAG: hypothetical protein ABF643_03615 [Oenococcus oeni]
MKFNKNKKIGIISTIIIAIIVIIAGITIVIKNSSYSPTKDLSAKFSGYSQSGTVTFKGNIPSKIAKKIAKSVGLPSVYADQLIEDQAHITDSLSTETAAKLVSDSSLTTENANKVKKYIEYMQDISIAVSNKQSVKSLIASIKKSAFRSTGSNWDNYGTLDETNLKNGQDLNYVVYVKKDSGNPIKTSYKTFKVSGLKKPTVKNVSSIFSSFSAKFEGLSGQGVLVLKGIEKGKKQEIIYGSNDNNDNVVKGETNGLLSNGDKITLLGSKLAKLASSQKTIYKGNKNLTLKVSGLVDPKKIDLSAIKKSFLAEFPEAKIKKIDLTYSGGNKNKMFLGVKIKATGADISGFSSDSNKESSYESTSYWELKNNKIVNQEYASWSEND